MCITPGGIGGGGGRDGGGGGMLTLGYEGSGEESRAFRAGTVFFTLCRVRRCCIVTLPESRVEVCRALNVSGVCCGEKAVIVCVCLGCVECALDGGRRVREWLIVCVCLSSWYICNSRAIEENK